MNKVLMIVVLFTSLLGARNEASAQNNKTQDSLYYQVLHLDSVVFTAFNNRDLQKFNSFFVKDLEFFHDKGGLTGYQQTVDFLKRLADTKSDLKRELVKEATEIYPIPGYGAIQIGVHKFIHTENGKIEIGHFKFVHIWKQTGNDWQITRVVSYDH
jgi:hypothetical protein